MNPELIAFGETDESWEDEGQRALVFQGRTKRDPYRITCQYFYDGPTITVELLVGRNALDQECWLEPEDEQWKEVGIALCKVLLEQWRRESKVRLTPGHEPHLVMDCGDTRLFVVWTPFHDNYGRDDGSVDLPVVEVYLDDDGMGAERWFAPRSPEHWKQACLAIAQHLAEQPTHLRPRDA